MLILHSNFIALFLHVIGNIALCLFLAKYDLFCSLIKLSNKINKKTDGDGEIQNYLITSLKGIPHSVCGSIDKMKISILYRKLKKSDYITDLFTVKLQ